jgi:ATP-dependent Lhr-like helicase
VQERTIPGVLDGANVVISSPPATGKTEAVIAPIAQMIVERKSPGLSVIYVCPTRALVNDACSRVQGPLSEMGLKCAIKTGDRPYFNVASPPNILITTPESLDSLIARRNRPLTQAQVLVLDEIHLLDGTYRGDHLRALVRRLSLLVRAPDGPATHLLSATLSDPQEVGTRYIQGEFQVIHLPGVREMNVSLIGDHADVPQFARAEGLRKVLYFCNKRSAAEELATALKQIWPREWVVVHHGSVAKRFREEAEVFMKEASRAVCVATSTLEIGIDIGDIDAIVLAEVPWSLSSLVQRLGRGNRRQGTTRVFGLFRTEEERVLLEAMLEAARSGELEQCAYQPDLSVAVQQALSMCFQYRRGIDLDLATRALAPLCSRDDMAQILDHLTELGLLERHASCWCGAAKAMALGELGKIHSNIPDEAAWEVYDTGTRSVVGQVQLPVNDVFALAGRTWKVLKLGQGRIVVRRAPGAARPTRFRRRPDLGAFFGYLPTTLQKRVLKSKGLT